MSEVDIEAGERWGDRLWRELQDSQFGVVCLTAENLQAPWLHYEAGALAKAVDRRVCPYLYKIKPTMVQGPLSHHQTKQVDKQGTKELLHSINTASLTLTKIGLPSEQLDKSFNTWWPQLEEKFSAVPPSTTAPPPRREIQEIVEEILEIVRNQQIRQASFTRKTPFQEEMRELATKILREKQIADATEPKMTIEKLDQFVAEIVTKWANHMGYPPSK
jgi:hypothetical protein